MTPQEFANSIRQKYPRSYDNLSDEELSRKVIAKYPVYADKVNFATKPEEKKGLISSIKSAFSSRVGKAQEAQDKSIEGKQSLASGTLQTIGQGAGFVADVVGETAIATGKTLLPKVAEEKIAETASKIFSTKPVQEAVKLYTDFSSKHPEAAKDLEAVVNIGSLLPIGGVGKVGVKAGEKALIKTGTALEKSGLELASTQKQDFVRSLIRPEQTKAVKEAQVSRTTETGVGPFKKSVVEPTAQELKSEKAVLEIPDVKPENTFQQNYNIIKKSNTDEAVRLEQSIADNDFVIPKKEVISRLNSVKKELAKSPILVGDAEKTVDKLLAGAIDFVNKNEGKGTGLLQAKKDYDAWVLSQKPKTFDATADNAFTIANREVRNVFKDILDENAPNVGVKDSLAKQSALYNAMDNIEVKAAKEADTALARTFQRVGQAIGVRNEAVKSIAAATGIFGIGAISLLNPIATYMASATALGFLAYKGGKLVLKPQVRIGLGKLLKEAGNKISQADKLIIEKALLEQFEE